MFLPSLESKSPNTYTEKVRKKVYSQRMIISKKKPIYFINDRLKHYLERYDREVKLPLSYEDLTRWSQGMTLYDADGKDTLWESVIYPNSDMEQLQLGLTKIYALLKTDGDTDVIQHLKVDRIDYCHFGNSKPFRIKIKNQFNDNHDYFYIKKADASRVYGLELEYILSPNRISFIVDGTTLIEEHIAGIPGDIYLDRYMYSEQVNKAGLAKEFVKFNERCFVLLLGDMRSYNYVIDVTPDFDREQYRVRPIDFDQQCYEGRRQMYLPQFFKENLPVVEFCTEILTPVTVNQYQYEERVLIKKRYLLAQKRLNLLLDCMSKDQISKPDKIKRLKSELNAYHQTRRFNRCVSMGGVLRLHLLLMLGKPKPKKWRGKTTFKT